MSISSQFDTAGILLFAGYSDGFVRLLHFDKEWKLLDEQEQGRCLLKTCAIKVDEQTWFLSAGTDGLIVFWQVKESKLVEVARAKVHQSGVNALDAVYSNGQVIAVSGGDDNSMSMTLLAISDGCVSVWRYETGHSSIITGIKILGDVVLSTGIDQRLKLWKIQNGELNERKRYKTCVADISDMDVKR